MENLSELYYEKLSDTDRPGNILARFYCALAESTPTNKEIILFNKLVKVYGKYIPFFAILDLYSYEEADRSNPYALLSYYCKKRLEQKSSISVVNDAFKRLDSLAERVVKQIEEQKKLPIDYKGKFDER